GTFLVVLVFMLVIMAAMAIGVMAILVVLILPMPPVALDMLLAFSIILSVLVLMTAYGAWQRARGWWLRGIAFALVLLALVDPSLVREQRAPKPDTAVVVVDQSASQRQGGRSLLTEAALADLEARAKDLPNLDLRIVRHTGGEQGTRLIEALNSTRADIPTETFAGAFLITDGQDHDTEAALTAVQGPLHLLLTGTPDEIDRRLVIDRAPTFGIVGQGASLTYRVEDQRPVDSRARPASARVTARLNGTVLADETVLIGQPQVLDFTIDHAGTSLVELEAEPAEGELSTVNNKTALAINGVRDRLRVLLVSGQPHAGERNWRNLLKSDLSVDLVHFTILRPPEKDDFTPLRELSLIVFPTRELFEEKLDDFNLIVFDRYVIRDVLPPSHLRNIRNYVENGGALLAAVGPEFAGIRSLYRTALGAILPAEPHGPVLEGPFKPDLTDDGQRHPVTAGLSGSKPADASPGEQPRWGPWFRQLDVALKSGRVLMKGLEESPLLIVDRVGEGRVGLIASDHLWLWARGYDGGGPQTELMRRLAHWLMREPELEEERLTATGQDGELVVRRASLDGRFGEATITLPSGARDVLSLTEVAPGRAEGRLATDEQGLFRIEQDGLSAIATSGSLNSPEFADLRATDRILGPLAAQTNGGVHWLKDQRLPELRRVAAGHEAAGKGWLGIVRNNAFTVTGVEQLSLIPGPLLALLLLLAVGAAWWREGR
ncbi:MAG: hypothetical protein ACPGNT_01270, partial [Rhodospirillales bacterium]